LDVSLSELVAMFARGPVCVLTGAGVSTDSGIPDYRGPGTAARARNPVQYRDFVHRPLARKRYWARSLVGFPRFFRAKPNVAHRALAELEQRSRLTGLITQNVDGLHGDAGSRTLVELHGRLREVVCLSCGALSSRVAHQRALEALNPEFARETAELAPDGDADLERDLEGFRVVDCARCGGVLKPHVVFFGENVPKPRVHEAYGYLDAAESLLVVGSSLTVYSGLRFVRRAAEQRKPVAIVNLGPTRGDEHAEVKIDAGGAETLSAIVQAL
jgi:NAD-dependent SIR2 family protein deacetylase